MGLVMVALTGAFAAFAMSSNTSPKIALFRAIDRACQCAKCTSKYSGMVENCCCDYETVDNLDEEVLNPSLQELVKTPFFKYFKVEHVVGIVKGAVLVVDAGEGPLAQTKFVLAKALKYGLRPILLLNKVDRPSVSEETCDEVERLVFDLFANLGATEEQLDFPVLYASAKEGWASTTFTKDPPADAKNISQLLDAIITHLPPPNANIDAPFQMLCTFLFYQVQFIQGSDHCVQECSSDFSCCK